jgi:branched-chain amino acid transport system substrate-binding protein
MDPKLPPVIKMVGEEFDKVKPGVAIRSAHVGMAASNTYLFLTDVLPRAIKKYGGIDSEALRKAALDTDIPVGGTLQGYGVKFYPPGSQLAGQNERAFPVVMQYVNGRARIVWPREVQTTDPVLPFPKGHTFAP